MYWGIFFKSSNKNQPSVGYFANFNFIFATEALMNKTNGEFIITNDDPGYAVIFATYPAPYASVMGAIGDQVRMNRKLLSKKVNHLFIVSFC